MSDEQLLDKAPMSAVIVAHDVIENEECKSH